MENIYIGRFYNATGIDFAMCSGISDTHTSILVEKSGEILHRLLIKITLRRKRFSINDEIETEEHDGKGSFTMRLVIGGLLLY